MAWVTVISEEYNQRLHIGKRDTENWTYYGYVKEGSYYDIQAYYNGQYTGSKKVGYCSKLVSPYSLDKYRIVYEFISYDFGKTITVYRDDIESEKYSGVYGRRTPELYNFYREYIDKLIVKIQEDIQLPSTPSSITVTPLQVKEGEKINISWNSDYKIDSYRLERSVNGGSWAQISSSSSRSYTDTAQPTLHIVQYRVRGYNGAGYSSYKESDIVQIIHFPSLGLKINGVLKESDMDWVKVNGKLKEIDSIYTKVNSVLKEVE